MKIKNPVMVEQREISHNGALYTYRKWDNGDEQFYRHNRRQACLVKLDADRNQTIIAKIRAAME